MNILWYHSQKIDCSRNHQSYLDFASLHAYVFIWIWTFRYVKLYHRYRSILHYHHIQGTQFHYHKNLSHHLSATLPSTLSHVSLLQIYNAVIAKLLSEWNQTMYSLRTAFLTQCNFLSTIHIIFCFTSFFIFIVEYWQFLKAFRNVEHFIYSSLEL